MLLCHIASYTYSKNKFDNIHSTHRPCNKPFKQKSLISGKMWIRI